MTQPSLSALFDKRQPSALFHIERGNAPNDVYDGMLVVHHLFQGHEFCVYLCKAAVNLTGYVKTVACPKQVIGVFCIIGLDRAVLGVFNSRVTTRIFPCYFGEFGVYLIGFLFIRIRRIKVDDRHNLCIAVFCGQRP